MVGKSSGREKGGERKRRQCVSARAASDISPDSTQMDSDIVTM